MRGADIGFGLMLGKRAAGVRDMPRAMSQVAMSQVAMSQVAMSQVAMSQVAMAQVVARTTSFLVGCLCALIMMGALTIGPACAQNLDQDKSGMTLFAASCKDCHPSPRGLAKERFSWTLTQFLQHHYTSSSASARVLTAYLQSADVSRANEAPRAKAQPAVRKSQPSTPIMSEPVLRPPASVPGR